MVVTRGAEMDLIVTARPTPYTFAGASGAGRSAQVATFVRNEFGLGLQLWNTNDSKGQGARCLDRHTQSGPTINLLNQFVNNLAHFVLLRVQLIQPGSYFVEVERNAARKSVKRSSHMFPTRRSAVQRIATLMSVHPVTCQGKEYLPV